MAAINIKLMQQLTGTAAEFAASNYILKRGEVGYETDTHKFKVGDGTSAWPALAYYCEPDADALAEAVAEKLTVTADGGTITDRTSN